MDGPPGSKAGPNALCLRSGAVRLMDEGGPLFTSATAINDRRQVAGMVDDEKTTTTRRARQSEVKKAR